MITASVGLPVHWALLSPTSLSKTVKTHQVSLSLSLLSLCFYIHTGSSVDARKPVLDVLNGVPILTSDSSDSYVNKAFVYNSLVWRNEAETFD